VRLGKVVVVLALVVSCRARQGPPTEALAELLRAAGDGNTPRVTRIVEGDPGLAQASWDGAESGPVRAAAKGGHLEALRILLDAGANLRERDTGGSTPLHAAKSAEVVALLLERGVSPDVRSRSGETPLMTTAGATAALERLLVAGARPNLRDSDGLTALHRAVNHSGREPLVSIGALCSFGADPGIRDEKGESAADLARRFAAEGIGERSQTTAMADLLAPGAGCDALRRRTGGRATDDERHAVLHDARCRHGNAWACGRLGWLYEHGQGVASDLPRSAKLYEQSCEQGHAWGCYALAYSASQGKGLPRDEGLSTQLFRRGCDAGHNESCGQFGRHLQRGIGITRDEAAAVLFFERACKGGEAWSCWQLGEALAAGRGVPRNSARATELRQQACAAGEKRACSR
jgi:hypothetical protein